MAEHVNGISKTILHLTQLDSLLKIKKAVFMHFHCQYDATHTDKAVHFFLDMLVLTYKLVK